MLKNKPLLILLPAVLIKGLAWVFLTPIFQVPDEPSHFSLVQFVAENNRRPHPRREVVTPAETMRAAEIVNFDWKINHPVWRGYTANWQDSMHRLDRSLGKQTIANDYQTSLKRPPAYYWLAWPFYRLGGSSFLGRFYAVRGLSVLLHLGTVWLAYLTGGLAVAALVAFQPMFSFIAAGVHYDPLAVLITTAFIYLIFKPRRRLSLLPALTGVLAKPDLIILPFFWLWRFFKKKRWLLWAALVGVILAFAAIAGPLDKLIIATDKYDRLLYLTNLNEYVSLAAGTDFRQLGRYLLVAGPAHLAQIFPWYWGTFGWLEASLPAGVFTTLKLAVLMSLLGWLKYIHHYGLPRKLGFFLGFVLVHAAGVVINDFRFFASRGEIYGIQGRYFFPAIVPQMILLTFGWRQWLAEKVLTKTVIVCAVVVNLIGLMTVYQYFGWVW